jgi:hypothetical protein
VTALAVIEDFDVVEDFGSGVGSAGKIASVDQFQFEGAPEAFHCSVVVAVTPSATSGAATTSTSGVASRRTRTRRSSTGSWSNVTASPSRSGPGAEGASGAKPACNICATGASSSCWQRTANTRSLPRRGGWCGTSGDSPFGSWATPSAAVPPEVVSRSTPRSASSGGSLWP